jgi:hypothetical protein
MGILDMSMKALVKSSNWRGESFYCIWWGIIQLYLICLLFKTTKEKLSDEKSSDVKYNNYQGIQKS